jgi:AraC-like DNA-binding protein
MFWGLTNLYLTAERVMGRPIAPRVVEFSFASPSAEVTREVRERFPVAFGAKSNRVVFSRSVGDLPIPSADADLKSLLEEVIEEQLNKLGPAGSFVHGLTVVLRGMLNGTMPTIADLSHRVDMSQRTLQRRLRESGTNFQKLLRKVLREVSDEHLRSGALSQSEIAFLLGYSEESAFSRAYRSWTGHAPSAARLF